MELFRNGAATRTHLPSYPVFCNRRPGKRKIAEPGLQSPHIIGDRAAGCAVLNPADAFASPKPALYNQNSGSFPGQPAYSARSPTPAGENAGLAGTASARSMATGKRECAYGRRGVGTRVCMAVGRASSGMGSTAACVRHVDRLRRRSPARCISCDPLRPAQRIT